MPGLYARCVCTDCSLALPVLGGRGLRLPGVSMVLWVCTDWRCSSLSLAGFLLLLTAFCCNSLSFASLLGFNYWFMYFSILGDQSLISNWWWGSRHVYIAIFSVLILRFCVCVCFVVFGSAPTLLVQVNRASGIAFWVPTLSVKSLYNISQNRWFGTMVHEPFGSRPMIRKLFGSRHDSVWTVMSLSGSERLGGKITIGLLFSSDTHIWTFLLNDTIVRGTVPGIWAALKQR